MAKVKKESEVWEIVNRERKGRKGINEEIELEEWREYFMGLLGGEEEKVSREEKGEEEIAEKRRGGEEEIGGEEIREERKSLRVGKASGIDEIPNELWKYGGEELEEWNSAIRCGEEKDGQRNGKKK